MYMYTYIYILTRMMYVEVHIHACRRHVHHTLTSKLPIVLTCQPKPRGYIGCRVTFMDIGGGEAKVDPKPYLLLSDPKHQARFPDEFGV